MHHWEKDSNKTVLSDAQTRCISSGQMASVKQLGNKFLLHSPVVGEAVKNTDMETLL